MAGSSRQQAMGCWWSLPASWMRWAVLGCAVAIQRVMLAFNAKIDTDRQIVLRIGINVGDIIIDGDDVFGDGVNVAARLEALCEPGGVRIYGNVWQASIDAEAARAMHEHPDNLDQRDLVNAYLRTSLSAP